MVFGRLRGGFLFKLLLRMRDETATPPNGGVSGTTRKVFSGGEAYILPCGYSDQRGCLRANTVDHT
jgi:hypothetical protein